MPRSLGDTLKVWHLLAAVILQSGALIAGAAWWAATKDLEVRQLQAVDAATAVQVKAMASDIIRIDMDGSRVWAQHIPNEERSSAKVDTRLAVIEEKFNTLNLAMTRLIVLSEQNQKLLNGNQLRP